MYAQIKDNKVIKYPYDQYNLKLDNPNTSFPDHIDNNILSQFGIFQVIGTSPQPYDTLQFKHKESTPLFSSEKNSWIQSWELIPLTQEEKINALKSLKNQIIDSAQFRLDSFVQEKGYDNILSAITYSNSTNPMFASDAAIALKARDDTWTKLVEVLSQYEAGTLSSLDIENIMSQLPILSWN